MNGDGHGPVVIVGASLAGLTAATTLRNAGYDAPVTVLEAAPQIPHDRPPLSKQVLAGEWEPDRAVLRVAERLVDADLDLRLGTAVTALDAASRTVTLGDGTTIAAAGIVLATGASPRHLPEEPPGTHVLRNLADCEAIRADLSGGARVTVIGAGFIGAEVAATCRGMGLAVTMIEAGDVPMGRVLPGSIGSFVADLHRSHGVDVRLGVGVDHLVTGDDGRVAALQMADGRRIDADVVVVGIGVTPNTAAFDGSGLTIDNGVRCDASLLAAPGVVAAGDLASWPNARFGDEVMRVEQWENAIESGEHAARRLLGDIAADNPEATTDAFSPIPWFWSDQYDRKIQMAGRPSASDTVHIVEGSIDEQRFVALFRRDELCTGVLGVNRPRHVMQARMRMAESLDWSGISALF